MTDRREFIKKITAGAAAITLGGVGAGFSSKSYSKIIGANDHINIAFIGCGRRVPAYYDVVTDKKNNIDLLYICDVMKSQREKTAKILEGRLNIAPTLTSDIHRAIEDSKVDAIFNATPDHWHAPGTFMALEAGKHVYVEKPCCHNPYEGELLVSFQKKYDKVVQMGNQQRSALESIEIVTKIHEGIIGKAFKAIAFYTDARGEVPIAIKTSVPDGLDWELFQGPAPHMDYMYNTWDYNWHWYGWTWGTAEAGNNGTHELDIARWALQVEYPEHVVVDATKRYFENDGWTMYDSMDATFSFPGNKIIKWDGQSRNGYRTYGSNRGTIIYGTNGSVYVDRDKHRLYDRSGILTKEVRSGDAEAGNVLGGGGGMTNMHVVNFFDAIRGKAQQRSPIAEGVKSTLLCHLANISYRVNKPFNVNPVDGHIYDKTAMKLWKREYEQGWEPKI